VSAVVWGAVAFCLAVVVGSLVGVGLLAWRGWRQVQALRAGLLAAVGELGEAVAGVERRLASVETRSAELQRSLDRLSRTLAEARVLARAAGEVADLVGRVRGVVPTK